MVLGSPGAVVRGAGQGSVLVIDAPGCVRGVQIGTDGSRYLALTGVAILLLSAMLTVGLAVGLWARSRARAVEFAIVIWFALVVGVDFDAASLFQADLIAGPTGAALRRVLGGWGVWVLATGLAAWTALPLWIGSRRFAHRDL